MTRFEIRRDQELDGREYGSAQIRVKGGPQHGAICTPNSVEAGELVRQANAAAELATALREVLALCWEDEPEIVRARELLGRIEP